MGERLKTQVKHLSTKEKSSRSPDDEVAVLRDLTIPSRLDSEKYRGLPHSYPGLG
jgi:hypothetical protein